MKTLPVDSHLEDAAKVLREGRDLILRATPGSGKTTRLPPHLAAQGAGTIWVLEPRRLAARLAATRVAEERGWKLGQEVGYHFRLERQESARTWLLFLTEGMLLRRMIEDPELRGVKAVVLDEFHERHVHTDLAFACLRSLQARRKDLRLVLMSATLDLDLSRRALPGAEVMDVAGRVYPTEVVYQPLEGRSLEAGVRRALADEPVGDTLVFLPGMAEMLRTERHLRENGVREVTLLHGELSREQQAQAFAESGPPRVILATNVAESSITLPRVRRVIDSGLARIASFSAWSGIASLKTREVSRASLEQRAGRASRLAPGVCVRLMSKGEAEARRAFEVPEIERADLAQPLLELAAIGAGDPAQLPWFEKPSSERLEQGRRLLEDLGAFEGGELTSAGRAMARLPLHPRFARAMAEARPIEVEGAMAWFLAAATEGVLDDGSWLESFEKFSRQGGSERVGKMARRFAEEVGSLPRWSEELGSKIARCLLSGFPDRVARGQGQEFQLCEGGRIQARPQEKLEGWYLLLELREKQFTGSAKASLHAGAWVPIEEAWLWDYVSPRFLHETAERTYDSVRKKAWERTQILYGQIVIESRDRELEDTGEGAAARAEILAQEVLRDPVLKQSEALLTLGERLSILAERRPETLGGRTPSEWIQEAVRGVCAGIAHLRGLEITDEALRAALPWDQVHVWEQLLASHIQLKGGRRLRIRYEVGKPPWVESRMQDFFGMTTLPSLLGGALKLQVHLLAPNQRAVQVTDDLAGFWDRHYPTLKKELSRRYPRHAWPDDPRTASPPLPRGRG